MAFFNTPLIEELNPEELGQNEKNLSDKAWRTALALATYPHLIFLDSTLWENTQGRYSFIAADPAHWFKYHPDQISTCATDPFEYLKEKLAPWQFNGIPDLPPFQGGLGGLFAYDLLHEIERIPKAKIDHFSLPYLAAGIYDWVIAFDHWQERAWLMSTGYPETGVKQQAERAAKRLLEVKSILAETKNRSMDDLLVNSKTRNKDQSWHPIYKDRPGPAYMVEELGLGIGGTSLEITSNFRKEEYCRAVQRVIDYIDAGDCFQVNLAQHLLAPQRHTPAQIYHSLRKQNQVNFAGYFDFGTGFIASSSPESFLRLRNSRIETAPIKGTRHRASDPAQDRLIVHDLLHNAKDRAENVMIVDLLRNDIGRVAKFGSIQIEAVCQLESYRYVHHLVSRISAELKQNFHPLDLLRAAFPGGSVTGAPKVRAMEIIAELEPLARGAYCGSLGYCSFNGNLDTNIGIRTMTIKDGWIQFPVGGGIVADSRPEDEYQETLAKAQGMLAALAELVK